MSHILCLYFITDQSLHWSSGSGLSGLTLIGSLSDWVCVQVYFRLVADQVQQSSVWSDVVIQIKQRPQKVFEQLNYQQTSTVHKIISLNVT